LTRGREALTAHEFTWAAELAGYVLANDGTNAGAKRIKAQALIQEYRRFARGERVVADRPINPRA
jgi:alkyl sulfatase BDS1-like metallo-beta-lactamase superfamily hydrolase